MKAVVYTRYGPPEVLQVREIEKPTPNDNQVLVRVRAASLNPAEAHARNGLFMARAMGGTGLLKPKDTLLGADFAGEVEAVGRSVSAYQRGDRVFGRRSVGGFAEYVCVTEKPIALMPANASFEQAAAIPVAGLTALQSLRDAGQIQAGQQVLINGASGGVGTFTVQIAKAYGAHVTALCSTRNLELVRSLGADHVIDYTRDDFSRSGQRYDLIIDNVGNRTVADYRRALTPNGISVIIGYTSMTRMLQNVALGRLVSRFGSQQIALMIARHTHKDLTVMAELMEAGKVTPIIDRCYPLSQVVDAYRQLETKHSRGKIVVQLA